MCYTKQINKILDKLDSLLINEAQNINDYISGSSSKYNSHIFDLILDNKIVMNGLNPENNTSPDIYI